MVLVKFNFTPGCIKTSKYPHPLCLMFFRIPQSLLSEFTRTESANGLVGAST